MNGHEWRWCFYFPSCSREAQASRQAGKAGVPALTLANLGNGSDGKCLVSRGEDGTVGLEYCLHPPILSSCPFRWLLLAGSSRMLKLTTQCQSLRLSPLSHSARDMCCLSIPPSHPSKAKYLVFGNGLFAFLLPVVGRA